MIEVEEEDLMDLIHFARRYCDGRSTPSPFTFNMIYERLRDVRPELLQRMDAFDITLKAQGFWWPHAQDGNYNPDTGAFNAMPVRIQKDMIDREQGK